MRPVIYDACNATTTLLNQRDNNLGLLETVATELVLDVFMLNRVAHYVADKVLTQELGRTPGLAAKLSSNGQEMSANLAHNSSWAS